MLTSPFCLFDAMAILIVRRDAGRVFFYCLIVTAESLMALGQAVELDSEISVSVPIWDIKIRAQAIDNQLNLDLVAVGVPGVRTGSCLRPCPYCCAYAPAFISRA